MQLENEVPYNQTQSVRIINKAGLVYESTSQPETFYLACHQDITSGQTFILWDDVLDAFKRVVHVRDGARILPFLKGSDLRNLDPLRIAAVPNVTLSVVVEGQLARQRVPSLSTMVTDTAVQQVPSSFSNTPADIPSLQNGTPPTCTSSSTPQPIIEDIPSGKVCYADATTSEAHSESDSISNLNPSSAQTTPACIAVKAGTEDSYLGSTRTAGTPAQQLPCKYSSAVDPDASLLEISATANVDPLILVIKTLKSGLSSILKPMASVTVGDQGHKSMIRVLSSLKDSNEPFPQGIAGRHFDLALQGHPLSKYRVGLYNKEGQGVPQDCTKAMEWLLKAAINKNADAQFEIGELYYFGRGVSEDNAEAMEWYLKAAGQDHADAQWSIGYMYYHGHGVPPDRQQALKWYQKAADHGHPSAQYEIGEVYYYGRGVPMDDTKATKWYLKAAKRGHVSAQHRVGFLYEHGVGATGDEQQPM
ncbi:hypothetical protein BGZ95_008442 [Linnemannia exigua]|uniref:HCP-like protein n=1 Tax=Linnemannia exigua TaxID=604196 RepID=A0AAD4DE43_9FUNG|nr:hypothetical protein BGZ95_008442 [Linnemannia exigua]